MDDQRKDKGTQRSPTRSTHKCDQHTLNCIWSQRSVGWLHSVGEYLGEELVMIRRFKSYHMGKRLCTLSNMYFYQRWLPTYRWLPSQDQPQRLHVSILDLLFVFFMCDFQWGRVPGWAKTVIFKLLLIHHNTSNDSKSNDLILLHRCPHQRVFQNQLGMSSPWEGLDALGSRLISLVSSMFKNAGVPVILLGVPVSRTAGPC